MEKMTIIPQEDKERAIRVSSIATRAQTLGLSFPLSGRPEDVHGKQEADKYIKEATALLDRLEAAKEETQRQLSDLRESIFS